MAGGVQSRETEAMWPEKANYIRADMRNPSIRRKRRRRVFLFEAVITFPFPGV